MNENAEALSVTPVSKCLQTTKEEKAEWARRFFESGLSIRKFSAQYALPRMSLWRWVDKSREPAKPEALDLASGALPAFTEIKLPAPVERSNGSHWAAELSWPNGRVLRLSKEVPSAMLEELLRVC